MCLAFLSGEWQGALSRLLFCMIGCVWKVQVYLYYLVILSGHLFNFTQYQVHFQSGHLYLVRSLDEHDDQEDDQEYDQEDHLQAASTA